MAGGWCWLLAGAQPGLSMSVGSTLYLLSIAFYSMWLGSQSGVPCRQPEAGGLFSPSLGSNVVSATFQRLQEVLLLQREGQWILLLDGRGGKGFEAIFNSPLLWLDSQPWGLCECRRRGCSSPGGALGHLPCKASKGVREISGSGISSSLAPWVK